MFYSVIFFFPSVLFILTLIFIVVIVIVAAAQPLPVARFFFFFFLFPRHLVLSTPLFRAFYGLYCQFFFSFSISFLNATFTVKNAFFILIPPIY